MKFWRKYHKIAGIILSTFLILFAISGIILNHRPLFNNIDLPRSVLTSSYQYKNWNNAAVKGSIELNDEQFLFYGNIGCWLYNQTQNKWTDYNKGFPKGIDNRKISKLILTSSNELFAGTHFGLFEHKKDGWCKISLPTENSRITDLIETNDTLHILTRSDLGLMPLITKNRVITIKQLPTPDHYQSQTSLFRTLWVMHSGEILGIPGKILVDIIAILFVFFVVTGLIWFTNPRLIKKIKQNKQTTKYPKRLLKWSVKWHNKIGIYTAILLMFTTFTGLFLRPPFLIAIANSQVTSIPNTILDTPNAWHDQLRAIRYNPKYDFFLISTSKGFYALTKDYSQMIKIPASPPVSVMGINVFEPINNEEYLIGSFSGLFRWNPISSEVKNYITNQPIQQLKSPARPISDIMTSGYYKSRSGEYYFDYNKGIITLTGETFIEMPHEILKESPISLWNVALEWHTGRIFQDFIGPFYILIIPLTGLSTLILLGSGVWIWWKKYKKS